MSNFNINGSGTIGIIIDPALIASSSSYTKSGGDATISFCHRFSLFEDETEVNFVEIKSTINIDLSHNNQVTLVDVAHAGIPGLHTTQVTYDVTAYYCDKFNEKMTEGKIFQGESIRVCVKPNDSSIVQIEKLVNFVWKTSSGITQHALNAKGVASKSLTKIANSTSISIESSSESFFEPKISYRGPVTVMAGGTVYLTLVIL
mmetsp:Transcript_56739/g.66336  ORF Transcript_56739/g.66336 Transcript_56739/m.66336 type:complete len:203 (-) Transcript_56739:59-667(-)